MATFLTDTNILIDVLANRRGHKELLARLVKEGNRLACCTVVVAELFAGIKPADSAKVDELVKLLTWYGSTPAVSKRAGQLRFEYARKGVTLSLADTLIAATALENDLTLITENRKHFPMPELSVHTLPPSV